MPVREVIERVRQDPEGVLDGMRLFLVLQLDQEAFTQVTGAHAGGLELLDDLEHLFYLFLVVSMPARKAISSTRVSMSRRR